MDLSLYIKTSILGQSWFLESAICIIKVELINSACLRYRVHVRLGWRKRNSYKKQLCEHCQLGLITNFHGSIFHAPEVEQFSFFIIRFTGNNDPDRQT
jgi:hypothetical protein